MAQSVTRKENPPEEKSRAAPTLQHQAIDHAAAHDKGKASRPQMVARSH